MAAPTNLVDSEAINYGLTREFINHFNQDADGLMGILGITSPEIVPAGYTLTQYKVGGALNNQATGTDGTSGTGYVEGDLVALSKYSVTPTSIGKVTLRPYRKVTSAQAISEKGHVPAVMRTDSKMLGDIRADLVDTFFTFLAAGTGTATGKTLQAALAYGEQALLDELEDNGDAGAGATLTHWVNRADAAAYLADAEITTQTSFGLTYLENFLGVANVIVTSKVPSGTVYVTPSENLHLYGADFAELSASGLTYELSDSGLIGVAHQPVYDHVSVETDVLTGALLFAEVTDYVVKSTIASE